MYLYRILLNLCLFAPVCAVYPAVAGWPDRFVFPVGGSVAFGEGRGDRDNRFVFPDWGGVAFGAGRGDRDNRFVFPDWRSAAFGAGRGDKEPEGGKAEMIIARSTANRSKVIRKKGPSAKTFYRKGLRMQRSGRLDEAQQYYEAAIKEDALFTGAYLALAGIYRQLHQPEPAKQQLQLLLQHEPAHAEAWGMLAALHFEQRAWEDAVTCAYRARELGEPRMNRLIGLGYTFLDHPAEALQALDKAHKENELDGEEMCQAARVCAQLEEFSRSIQYYEESLKSGGNPPVVYYELGMMHFNMKNYKQATGAFEQAARSGRPVDADFYVNLGMAHLKQARYDDAISNLQSALSLRPKDIRIIQHLANACYKKQDFKQAATQWNKILMMQPQNAFAMFMLGKSYMGCGELVKGQAICDQALLIGEK